MLSTEPAATALLLTICGILLRASVLFSRASQRIGVPIVLLFLLLGMLAGSEGIGGIVFEDYRLRLPAGLAGAGADPVRRRAQHAAERGAQHLGAGRRARHGGRGAHRAPARRARRISGGSPGREALLLGAVVSSTDAASVFAVLRGSGLQLKRRVGVTLELESGLNDPVAVILTLALTAQPAPSRRR